MDYAGLLIVICLLIYLTILNIAYKRKSNIVTVLLLQLLIPFAIAVAEYIIEIEPLFVLLTGGLAFLWFVVFNYTELWLRLKYKFDEERVIVLNLQGNEPDSDTANTYKSRFKQNLSIERIIEQNFDLIVRLKGTEPFSGLINTYYEKHPEAIDVIAALKEIETKKHLDEAVAKAQEAAEKVRGLPGGKSRRGRTSQKVEHMTGENAKAKEKRNLSEIRQESRLILKHMFAGWYFHVRYMRWLFWLDVDWSIDLHGYLKLYIVSPHQVLPTTLDLNCVLLQDEKENNKKFTVMFALHGYRIEEVAEKLRNLTNDLECFKFFPKFGELDKLQQETDYWKKKCYDILNKFKELAKHDRTINQDIEDMMPQKKRKKHRITLTGGGDVFGE